jgi:hypothetical protein
MLGQYFEYDLHAAKLSLNTPKSSGENPPKRVFPVGDDGGLQVGGFSFREQVTAACYGDRSELYAILIFAACVGGVSTLGCLYENFDRHP